MEKSSFNRNHVPLKPIKITQNNHLLYLLDLFILTICGGFSVAAILGFRHVTAPGSSRSCLPSPHLHLQRDALELGAVQGGAGGHGFTVGLVRSSWGGPWESPVLFNEGLVFSRFTTWKCC